MTTANIAQGQAATGWEDDVVYCEAVCAAEDVYYQGSEDVDHESPTTRRLRYGAAGQRFLDGHVPFLLSATLRGPFDHGSGWANPWRSRQRAIARRRPPHVLGWQSPIEEEPTIDSLECHLPSPESLNQASVAEMHPYLRPDELAVVHNWQRGVQVPSSQDSFWASSKARTSSSAKKRRTGESGWLRRAASKKRKTDSSNPRSSKSPLAQRESGAHSSPIVSLQRNFRTSPKRSPGRPTSFPQRLRSTHPWRGLDESEQDELTASTPDGSSSIAPERVTPTIKRVSPRQEMRSSSIVHPGDSEDELGQDKAAGETLSSPVSEPYEGLTRCTPEVKIATQGPTAFVASKPSSAKTKSSNEHDQEKRGTDGTDRDQWHDEIMLEGDSYSLPKKAITGFQTQQDHSFCFRMRCTTETDSESDISDQMSLDKPDQQSASLSSEDAVLPSLPTQELLSGAHIIENTPVQIPGRGDQNLGGADCGDGKPDPSMTSNDRDRREMQPTRQQPDETPNVPRPPSVDVAPHSQQATGNYLPGNIDRFEQEATPLVPPAQPAAGNFLTPAGPESKKNSSSSSPLASQQEPVAACEESLPQYGDAGADHNSAPPHASSASKIEQAMPAVMDSSKGECDIIFLGSISSDGSSGSGEGVEARGHAAVEGAFEEAVLPAGQEHVPMREPDKRPSESSFKKILHRLIPLSPWARLSQLTTRSIPLSSQAETGGLADEESADMESDDEAIIATPDRQQSPAKHAAHYEVPSVSAGLIEEAAAPHSSLAADPATATIQSNGDGAADGATLHNALEPNLLEIFDKAPITASQQSPWTKTEASRHLDLPVTDTPSKGISGSPSGPALAGHVPPLTIPPEAQSPWPHGADILMEAKTRPALATHATLCDDQDKDYNEDDEKFQTPVRPLTLEPHFVLKSFSSFMSPSPDRSLRRIGRTRLCVAEGNLPSAMKNPWSGSRAGLRVSWASMPQDREDALNERGLEGPESMPSAPRDRGRQASPPPATPIGDLPVSEDARFSKHFAAVVSRTDGLRQKLIPTASQQVLQSPGLLGMAEAFLTAEVAGRHALGVTDASELISEASPDQHAAEVRSHESMEMVEDVLREMGDFLQTWDIDAELDQARKGINPGERQLTRTNQSPW